MLGNDDLKNYKAKAEYYVRQHQDNEVIAKLKSNKPVSYTHLPVRVKQIEIGSGMPKVCVPIVGRTEEEILAFAKEVEKSDADIVEWRADWYEEVLCQRCV